MATVNALGGELGLGISNLNLINQLGKTSTWGTGWSAQLEDNISFINGNEAWFGTSSGTTSYEFVGQNIPAGPVPTGVEYEVNLLSYFAYDHISGGRVFWELKSGTNSSFEHIRCEGIDSVVGEVFRFTTDSGAFGATVTDVQVLLGEPMLWTIRAKNIGGNQARYEVYLNGVQLLGAEGNASDLLNDTETLASDSQDFLEVFGGGTTTGGRSRHRTRGLLWKDAWTTANDVPPTLPYVYDAEFLSFNDAQSAFTEFGGAAGPIEAMGDLSANTGLASSTPGTSALFRLAAPSGLENETLAEGFISTLQSRVGTDPVSNRIAMIRESDFSALSSEDIPLTTASPSVQVVNHIFTPSASANLDDLTLQVTNDRDGGLLN